MARRGMTAKPCEGCGAAGTRPVGKLCGGCSILLTQARALRDEQKRGAATEERVILGRGATVQVARNARSHDRDHELVDAFTALAEAVSEPVVSGTVGSAWRPGAGVGHHMPPTANWRQFNLGFRVFRPDVAAALDALWHAVETERMRLDEEAFLEGTRMLRRIASGDVSVERLNELSIAQHGRMPR